MPTLSRAALLALAPLVSIVFACSSTPNTPAPDAATQICPVTIFEATSTSGSADGGPAGDSCVIDGYICVVGFQCTNFTQQATCTCTNNNGAEKWACVLPAAKNMPVPDDTTDTTGLCQAIPEGDAGEACPATEDLASGAVCHAPGEQCQYQNTTCDGGVLNKHLDVCECGANNNGDAGLSWACDVSNCQ